MINLKIMWNLFFRPVRHRRGLTLVEITLAAVLTAMIALALYSAIAGGMRVWKRGIEEFVEQDIAIFFERFSQDARNAYFYPGYKLIGNKTTFSLPTFVWQDMSADHFLEGAPRLMMMGAVRYSYDPLSSPDRVQKSQMTYSDLYRENEPPFTDALAGISDCAFQYYGFDESKKEMVWSDQWPLQDQVSADRPYPAAIRVTIDLQRGQKVYAYNRTVFFSLSR